MSEFYVDHYGDENVAPMGVVAGPFAPGGVCGVCGRIWEDGTHEVCIQYDYAAAAMQQRHDAHLGNGSLRMYMNFAAVNNYNNKRQRLRSAYHARGDKIKNPPQKAAGGVPVIKPDSDYLDSD